MKYIVLSELPQGQQPGEIIDLHEDVGTVLIVAGAARVATEDEVKQPRRGRRYQRRDMVAAGE
jgi:hypothetical protein